MSEPSKRSDLSGLESQVASELLRAGGFPSAAQNKRIICPECSHTRQLAHRREKVMSATTRDDRVLFTCHHCGVSGSFVPEGTRLRDRGYGISGKTQEHRRYDAEAIPLRAQIKAQAKRARKVMDAAPACIPPQFIEWDEPVMEFLTGRGISRQTCEDLGVLPAMVRFHGGISRVLAFPYRRTPRDEPYAWKLRFMERKGFMCLGKPLGMFGAENIAKDDTVFLVEGEMDVLALAEVGSVAVSVPHGAMTPGSDPTADTSRLRCLEFSSEELELAQRLVIAVDSDDPGVALGEEMARRLGKERVWQIDWLAIADAKDANEVLMAKGRDGLSDALGAAEPWPLTGIVNASDVWDEVLTLYRQDNMSGLSTGLPSFDKHYTIAPGMLSVLTGHPNSGKSEWLDQVLMQLAERSGWNLCIASFENPIQLHIAKLIEKRLNKTFFKRQFNRMTEAEVAASKDFIDDHFNFLDFSQGAMPTISEVLDRAALAVQRHGSRGLVIDPFNNLVPETKEGWSTERISELLTRV
jgi:twinkle protein